MTRLRRLSLPALLLAATSLSACGGGSKSGQGGTTLYLSNALRQSLMAQIQGPHQPQTQVTLVTTDQGALGPTTTFDINASLGDVISIQAIAGTVTGPTLTCTVTQATADCGGVVEIVGTTSATCQNWWSEYTGPPPNANCEAQP